MKKIFISKSTKRIAFWNIGVMLSLYITFLFFTLFTLDYVLIDDVDSRLTHEIEHIRNSIAAVGDSIIIINPAEFQEPDLRLITDNPFFLQIYDLEGKIFLRSENLNNHEPILAGFPNVFNPYYFESFFINEEHLRTIYKPLINTDGKQIGYVQLSTPHSSFNKVVQKIFWFNVISLPIIFFLIIFLSVFLAKKSYSPINKIIDLANSISVTNLSNRLTFEAEAEDEIGKLKNTLNSLFDRLETQIKEISQFSDNASHQLMTPLTAINSELDYILKKDRSSEDYKESLQLVQSQTAQMILIVKTLLILAKDCEVCTPKGKVFNFKTLMENQISKNYKNGQLSCNIKDNIYLLGEEDYFKMVVENIISNALKYSSNQTVIIEAEIIKDKASIRFKDQGIGIPDEEKKRVFDRFYRGKVVESEGIKGFGLGLSLSKLVVSKMNGRILIEDNIPQGTVFIIEIPVIKMN